MAYSIATNYAHNTVAATQAALLSAKLHQPLLFAMADWPDPIDVPIQGLLKSGMLVVGGDQAAILAHLQAGGVRGAEPFAGVTLVPVDQAALAQQMLSRPLAAPAGTQADRGSQRESATTTLAPEQNCRTACAHCDTSADGSRLHSRPQRSGCQCSSY